MIYFNDGVFTPYTIKAVFDDSGKEVVQYTDDKKPIEEMVRKFARMSDLRFEPNVLTQEQQERLNVLNGLDVLNGLYQAEPTLFVEHGVIYPDTECDFLSPLQQEYNESTCEHFRRKFREEINIKRDDLIQSGVKYDGYVYQTRNRDVSDLLGLIQLGQISEQQGQVSTTTWLTKDNVQITMSLVDLINLGKAVGEMKTTYVYLARQHKDAINSMTTLQDIFDYMGNISWEINQ